MLNIALLVWLCLDFVLYDLIAAALFGWFIVMCAVCFCLVVCFCGVLGCIGLV